MLRHESSEVLARLERGGQQELAAEFMQHRARLRRMVQRRMDQRLARRVDPSDILQEGFLDASRRLDTYLEQPPMPLAEWFRYLVRQCLCAAHRWHLGVKKRDVRKERMLASSMLGEALAGQTSDRLASAATSPSQALARRETQAMLHEVIEKLDPLDREIILLRHIEELSNRQAADALGVTPAAASKRYLRALDRIRLATGNTGRP